MLIDQFLQEVKDQIARIEMTQKERMLEAAQIIAESIEQGSILHIFGSGHSHMIAEDAFFRAGGLVCVNAMLEESLMEFNRGRSTILERLGGYAEVLLRGYDLRAGEVIIIISNSGINAVPIEMALECKARGLTVVALTNMAHSLQATSRHSSGKKLYEVADIVLDTCGAFGDATIPFDDSGQHIGPTSTISGVLIIQAITVAVIEELVKKGVTPPVLISANRDQGDGHNRELVARYKDRIRHLY